MGPEGHWTPDELRNMAWQIEQFGKTQREQTPYGEAEPMLFGLCSEALYDAANHLQRLLEGRAE